MYSLPIIFVKSAFNSAKTILSSLALNKTLPIQKSFNRQRLLLIVCLLYAIPVVPAQNSIEYKIKAGYIYNFTKFINWPALQSETFNLCIIGNDPFGTLLDPMQEKLAQGKPMRIIRLSQYQPDQICHISFFDSNQPDTENDTEDDTQNQASTFPLEVTEEMLTISNQSDFSKLGGIIEFIIVDDKIRLQIDIQRLRASGLEISAKLLEVSQVIGEIER